MLKKIIILGMILTTSSWSYGSQDSKYFELDKKPTIIIEEENINELFQDIKRKQKLEDCAKNKNLSNCKKYSSTLIALSTKPNNASTRALTANKKTSSNKKSTASNMVNLGKQAWKFIQDKKAVVDIKTDKATATPTEAKHWNQLSGWKKPKSYKFSVAYKNGWGFTVIKLTGRFIYTYGGQFQEKGQYLTNVAVIPEKVSVSWGHNLNARVEIMEPINMNTIDDPIAGMEVAIKWAVGTLNKDQQAIMFFVTGEGDVECYN